MSERVLLSSVLCVSEEAARVALELAGCTVEPGLAMTVAHPEGGTIHRVFGVLRNLVADDDITEEVPARGAIGYVPVDLPDHVEARGLVFAEQLVGMLDHPDNDRTRERLYSGTLKYTPINKRVAMRLRKQLGDGGAHLPWGLKPLNLDLSVLVQRHCNVYGFAVFYSRTAKLLGGEEAMIELKRVFSTPFGVAGFGTWQEPIAQEILDEDVGLVLEANYLVR